jgi:hypothetical protein
VWISIRETGEIEIELRFTMEERKERNVGETWDKRDERSLLGCPARDM